MNEKSRGAKRLEELRARASAPRVFISYSHDSADHRSWVLRLATDLRGHGIDAILDVWDLKPGEDVARFMEHLASVDRVVLVCSEQYAKKAAEGAGGVGYETMLVTAAILEDRGILKFVPIMRCNPGKALPPFLRTRLWIDFDSDAEYERSLEKLSRALLDVPAHAKPPLGQNPFRPGGAAPRDVLGDEWFQERRSLAMPAVEPRGAFMEVAFGLTAQIVKADQRTLLNVAERSMIHTFGWPIGAVLHVENRKPMPDPDGISATILSHGFTDYEGADYWALRCNGDFYFAENLFENGRRPEAIFFNTRMVRAAESLMYCRNLYENLQVEEGARIRFRIRHSGIQGRILSTSNPNRMMWPDNRKIVTDTAESTVEFAHPLSDSDVVEKTREMLDGLFVLFDFFKPAESIYQDVVGNFIQGRCT
jgi:hypothetical protein